MKFTSVAALGIGLVAATLNAQAQVTLKDQKDKASYSIGVNIGSNMRQQSVEINPDALVAGLKDALSGGKTQLTPQEMQETLMAFQKDMMAKQAEKAKVAGDKNKAEGEKFLSENKKKDGVKTTSSGLQYKVLTEGKGKKPAASDTVKVHYRGTLINGTEFDSSYKRNEPAEFPVNQVIPGWTEALQLMGVGSKYQLSIPSNLAYGERGQGPDIGPNATLLFDVELLEILPPEKASK